jgi:hypothetical protein
VATEYGSLPFSEQIAFFRSKVSMPTASWADVYGAQHDRAFMVAGAAKESLLGDLRSAIDHAVADGQKFEDFKAGFRDIAARHGWAYNGGENWRAQVIYETNLNQSYHAGREAQMADPRLRRSRPYGMYRHYASEHERPEHKAHDGRVVPLDDPWWDIWSGPNGWGCKCKKFAIGDRDVQRLGLKVEAGPPIQYETRTVGARSGNPMQVQVPVGIDPGFEYRPGARPLAGLVPEERDAAVGDLLKGVVRRNSRVPSDPLPTVRAAPADSLLPAGLADSDYVQAFMREFSSDGSATVFRDKAGAPVPITDDLFRRRDGRMKATKRGRERYLKLLAATIRDPDEIVLVEAEFGGKVVVRRRYIARWSVQGQAKPAMAIFELWPDEWAGITTFAPDDLAYLEAMREGFRIYRRDK